ncbi:MAG: transcriptional activator NhaR [Burkholderiaceae bacterium]|jgi:LysR family transcriptional activator of nhaA|nr:transcriptional activator NhaR [Burkholderiaceae bacterium]MCZ8175081.1 transcriptional activator NhaR [Burkholderiaceae bacterium]
MNFKHLHYFWVAAKAGGVVKAGEQLHTTPQTLSAQIKLLEERLGRRLFRKSGRQLELTEDGRVALRFADEIFALGGELETALREKRGTREQVLELRVGIEDVVAKSVAYKLLEPALGLAEPVKLICVEGGFNELMAQLALHRIDLVIADEPLTRKLSVKAFNHKLGSSPVSFFAAPELAARLRGPFPQCLDGAPMLVPGGSSSVRPQFDAWLERQGLHPRVVGEFGDGALMKAFGRQGRGVFLSPSVVEDETVRQYGVKVIGHCEEISDDFYAITAERRITHPGVAAITQAARSELFGGARNAATAA